MTPDQAKRALFLYSRYQCDGSAYRELAQSMGMNTAELNQACWRIVYGQKNHQWQAAIDRDLADLNVTTWECRK